ncbi:tRNA-splicing endonuclease subunit Sen2 [Tribolium castaneum]|uniref:tRNA-splicing endonuclease subunit Sen2 n=1 Tax=Tribolium castaneum TaxID=7070 RepID=D6WVU6_TRICA|nr:PREDICTED: tRNA-splicing endonuclease subunit Sen2 [Tribolium castaneum]EFA08240.1 tRNA-splicing endonuclease subunit Sen2-like Protein [Tribolium castaneum]|eukprot:XP_001810064.1 PREDICTED: tRNA-splicing endonuclease subunit Sen2 [Tribolium castaneum]
MNAPRPKKNCKLRPSPALPLVSHRIRGFFNGFCVTLDDPDDMKTVISMGYFGKANLSRNYPHFGVKQPEIVFKRVYENRKRHANDKPRKIVVLSDDLDDLTNFRPEFRLDSSGLRESVNLGLEEAFFLATAINCLDVYDEVCLSPEQLWEVFKKSDKYFAQNYIAYYYFRAKNWVVKPGIKFGGDFLLYKQGPPFYHASYVVIICVVDGDLKPIKSQNRRSMRKTHLMGLNRLCETARKELLICEIVCPGVSPDSIPFNEIGKFTIKETIMKRWTPQMDQN